ncbi:hypothetical protein, partial [Bittarella massiliensis (ex Durand et al. 2017)]|uniref:hypothetical protein n=1 Tax=Bittarella massiliensis (ex Durand et al. 2017) TaxID=1720313 RepID=UPI001AD8D095
MPGDYGFSEITVFSISRQKQKALALRRTPQPVEKVQRRLGFFACIRYNGSGGEKDAGKRK